jgi:PPM family protein phosphatase
MKSKWRALRLKIHEANERRAVEIEIVALSKQGGRSYNEDAHGHWYDGQYVACVVADGAGGHGGGDVASDLVRRHVLEAFSADPHFDVTRMRQLLVDANTAVLEQQQQGQALANMRTTIVLVVIDLHAHQMLTAHCGDSRAYLFRHDKVAFRTEDHSLVQQLVTSGMIDDEGARQHPKRNLLLSALGSKDEELQITVSQPIDIQPHDVLLLCSDGVWEPLGDSVFEASLTACPSPRSWLHTLDEQVSTLAKPGHDNYTALTLWAYADDESTLIANL